MEQSKFIEETDKLIALLSNYHNILEGNEAQTRWMLIDPFILDCWGYKREDIIVEYGVDTEERVNAYDKLDYSIILNNKPKLLVEAKSLGVDLYSKRPQLSSYFNNIHAKGVYNQKELIGILTDGDLYLFFTDSKELGILDSEPFYTIRLSCSDDQEILRLLNYSKDYLLNNSNPILINTEEYDLSTYYRIDMIEGVFNYFESLGADLCIHNVYIAGRLKNIKSFRGLYRELLKEVNKLQPCLLYELASVEESSRVEGSVSDCMFSLSQMGSNSLEIKTKQGMVYVSLSRTRKGLIDRIVNLLQQSSIGVFNVSVRVKESII